MNKNKLAAYVAGAALTALSVGCDTTTTTSTNATANTSNTAVVLNSNGNMAGPIDTVNSAANTNARLVGTDITRADYDREKDRYAREAKEGGRTIGTGVNDGWLWTKTRAALASTNDLRDSTINVDVSNDVVTLTGSVATQAQKQEAERVADSIDGVKNVRNQLRVAADGSAGATDATRNSNAMRSTNANSQH